MIVLNASHLGTGGKGDARTVCGLPRGKNLPALRYDTKFEITCADCRDAFELESMIRTETYDLFGTWA